MDVQQLTNGRIVVTYGPPVDYQSQILIDENYPSIVTYKCARTLNSIGKVYKTADGHWWLASCYLQQWQPIEVFSKIEGFLLLLRLYKQHQLP